MLTGQWLKRALVAHVFLGMVCLDAILWAGPNDGLTFYASFNQGLKADISAGNGQADSLKANLVEGHYEKGVRVEKGGYLNYPAAGNLSFQWPAGSICLWVKMDIDTTIIKVPEKPESRYINQVFNIESDKPDDRFQIEEGDNNLYFQTADASDPKKTYGCCMTHIPLNWKAGDWHQIVITWVRRETGTFDTKLYLDGKPGYQPREYNLILPSAEPKKMKIGYLTATDNPNNYSAYFNGVIDELRIYKRCLPPAEIKEMFAAGM